MQEDLDVARRASKTSSFTATFLGKPRPSRESEVTRTRNRLHTPRLECHSCQTSFVVPAGRQEVCVANSNPQGESMPAEPCFHLFVTLPYGGCDNFRTYADVQRTGGPRCPQAHTRLNPGGDHRDAGIVCCAHGGTPSPPRSVQVHSECPWNV